jgi:hypothetical protein
MAMGGMGLRAQGMDGRKKSAGRLLEYLIVGGGGGGGGAGYDLTAGGGGGGGQVAVGSLVPAIGSYTVTIGTGGIGGTNYTGNGADGTLSSAFGVSAPGGTKGFAWRSGGSPGTPWGGDSTFVGGQATTPQGGQAGGGGGGAASVGNNVTGAPGGGTGLPTGVDYGGDGGLGVSSDLSGSAQTYGGGGGGGGRLAGGAGRGGGGNGGTGPIGAGANAATNRGGGGGGGTYSGVVGVTTGGNGADGVAIFRYPTGAFVCTGGTITQAGGFTIHTFTTGGTFTRTA